MFRILNNDFKIIIKYKTFLMNLDNALENTPRRDMYYKDYIRIKSLELLEIILLINNSNDLKYLDKNNLLAKISLLDFLLERLFIKKYISEKVLYKLSNELVEINKMVNSWLNNYECKNN